MNKAELEQRIHAVCRMRRLAVNTERSYAEKIRHFEQHVRTCPRLTREEKLRTWLEQMAPHCSASSQNLVSGSFDYSGYNSPCSEGLWLKVLT